MKSYSADGKQLVHCKADRSDLLSVFSHKVLHCLSAVCCLASSTVCLHEQGKRGAERDYL